MSARYKKSVEPVYTDGRDIDLDLAALSGEAASQRSFGSSDEHIKSMAQVWEKVPSSRHADPTYYERPVLNEPVWKLVIPLYYYVGGLTGASLVLGAAVQLCASGRASGLIRRCHWIGLAGACISGALLIFDLGRPGRFLNMLRVFRPTSPMNIGAWVLCGTGGASTIAVLFGNTRGAFGPVGEASGITAGGFGMALATYTGVLLANSAVPLWQESRRVLPILFGASAIASAGSACEMFLDNPEELRVARAFRTFGQLAETASGIAMERQASAVQRVARPLKSGLSGALWRVSAVLTATSLGIGLLPNRSRPKRIAVGILGTLGSLLMRYAVAHAGVMSARDARASFHQQRAGHGAAELDESAAAIR